MGGKCDYNNSVEKFEQDSQSGPAPDRRINTMANCAIVGINWGDEGKGRMVDLLSSDYDIICRYQGGNNAGHTVVNDKGKFILNLLPSGILRETTVNVMGNGMVIDLEHLVGEVTHLREKGIAITPDNLKISDKAIICMPYHKLQDIMEEDRLADRVDRRLFTVFEALKHGVTPEKINEITRIDRFFLDKLQHLADLEKELAELKK